MLTQEEGFDKINSEKVVGAVMGMDVPLLRAVVAGYEAGARYYDSEVQVISSTVGSFGDPGKGKEMATAQYNQGADIILNGAGRLRHGRVHRCGGAGQIRHRHRLEPELAEPGPHPRHRHV